MFRLQSGRQGDKETRRQGEGRASRIAFYLLVSLSPCLLVCNSASACSVPVFRYALERWPADRYELVVFHRGPLKPSEKALLARLDKASDGKDAVCNLEVVPVNLDEPQEKPLADLWAKQKDAPLPHMVLRLPKVVKKQETVWAGPLNESNVATVLDSPLRHEIATRVLRGESAVWVFIESGDKEKDAAALKLLQKYLKQLQETLKLPELRENNPEDRIERGPGAPELKIAFSLVRLSRTDPAEAILLQMLLNVEEDLNESREPMALPVFGRGRALYALLGKGINEETITDACKFIIGACGCEVKRQNPGMDLLMSESWEAKLRGEKAAREKPPLIGLPATLPVETPRELPTVSPAPTAETGSNLLRNLLIVFGTGLALVAVATVVLLRLSKNS